MPNHSTEVHHSKLPAISGEQVHVGLLGRGRDEVPAVAQVGRAAVPLSVHRATERERLRRLPPRRHLELHQACVHAAAEHAAVVGREDAHDVVASRVQRLQGPVVRQRLPQVPDLARVVEGRRGEDVRRVVAEAANVDEVLVDAVRAVQHLARLDVVDGHVGRDAAGQEEVVGAVGAQGRELREGLHCLRARERRLGDPCVRVVLQEHDLPGVRRAAHGVLRVVLHPNEA
mmetsp:Transcript_43427/g.112132  ORF Transcript_43427/g.112132 Transcript_43427/m.112132 type:complete len:230 (+) Transcript_43427:592-1281(+)